MRGVPRGAQLATHASLLLAITLLATISSVDAASQAHVYELNGSFADALGGPALVHAGGSLNPTSYSFEPNQGLTLRGALANTADYSIELIFRFSTLSGYRRIIDFKDRRLDSGLYNLSTALNFFTVTSGPSGAFSPNVDTHVVVTREGATNLFRGYVNGAQQILFTDSGNLAVFSEPDAIMHFFLDDVRVSNEASAGVVDRIRIYTGALTAAEVQALAAARPVPTPTPIPIPLRTIDPRVVIPQVTPREIAITDTREVLPTGRTVSAEVAQALDAIAGRPGTTVTQDVQTGVTRLAVAGRTFTVWPLGAAQEARSGLTRQQGAGLALDPLTGTATITSAAGIQVRVMGVPPDLQAFLQAVVAAGVTGAQASPGQFLLTTGSPGLQFSTRLNFEVTGGGGAPGFTPNTDGSVTITYPGGERQQVFPVFADPASFLTAAAAFPGVTQATASLDGTVTVTAGAQTIRVRPDFTVGASPAGAKRILLDDPGGPAFDLGDSRRQRFTIVP